MKRLEGEAMDSIDRICSMIPDLVRRLGTLECGRPGDISHSQYRILDALQGTGPSSMGMLGRLIGAAQSTTSELASRMEKSGLVKKTRKSLDGRVVVVEITDRGRTLLRRHRRRMRESCQRLFDDAGDEARQAFLSSIETMLAILERPFVKPHQ